MMELVERKNAAFWDYEQNKRMFPVYAVDENGVWHFDHAEPFDGERTFQFRGKQRFYAICEILSKAGMGFYSFHSNEVTVFGKDDCDRLQNALEQADIWFRVKDA